MRSRSGGSAKRATSASAASPARLRPISMTSSLIGVAASAAINGTASRKGTMHRSWKSRIPTAICPCGASISSRSASRRITTAVLDMATRAPITSVVGSA